MKFLELAKKVLKDENKALTPDEIWRIAFEKEYVSDLKSVGRTPDVTLSAVLYRDVKKNKLSEFGKVETTPKRFYLKSQNPSSTNGSDSEIKIELDPEDNDVEKENTSSSKIDKPFDPKDVDITTKQLNLDLIFKRLKNGEINMMTDFQRKDDLWDNEKQSRLIESVLIRFPLPAFYFDGSNDKNWLVVDGLQRLSTFKNFIVNKTLKLQNLEFLTQFTNYGYDDLPRDLQRRIEETQVPTYIINPGTPQNVKFNIFKRINTGGLILSSQEIRHALNQGIPANFVKELANCKEFKTATNNSIKSNRMLDREFVTRFISFYLTSYKNYKSDLDTFLSNGMAEIENISEELRTKMKLDFKKSMVYSFAIFRRFAFRKRFSLNESRKPINKALFEIWSVSLSKFTDEELKKLLDKKDKLIDDYISLMNNDSRFLNSITTGTGDKSKVEKRFESIENIIKKHIS